MVVRRGRRERVVGDFGLEAISAQDTGFFGVVSCEVVGEVGKVGGEAGGEVGGVASDLAGEAVAKGIATGVGVVGGVASEVADDAIDEVIGVANATVAEAAIAAEGVEVDFSDFTCFVRTCSWSLVLLGYFSGQRLQAKASAFSFAIRASSAACCFAMRAFSACIAAGSNLFMRRSQNCCNEADFKLSGKSSCHCLASPFKE